MVVVMVQVVNLVMVEVVVVYRGGGEGGII